MYIMHAITLGDESLVRVATSKLQNCAEILFVYMYVAQSRYVLTKRIAVHQF